MGLSRVIVAEPERNTGWFLFSVGAADADRE
jgi:hypothetical protein